MRMWRPYLVAAAMAGLCGPAMYDPVMAQEATGMRLADAGFVMKEANTPRKMERLQTLPPHKFIRRVKNGVPYYIYADPTYCKCAMIGRQAAMDSYRAMLNAANKPDNAPPGYNDFARNPGGSNGRLESEMITDMGDDGETGMDDDLFHPGF
jgi:hypothetical protein